MDTVPVAADARPGPAMPFSGIVVPVPQAESVVRPRTLRTQPLLLPRDRSTVAHVTLLAPFYPPAEIDDPVIHHLARFFADVTAFAFELTEVCTFPGGVTYLAPEPAALFRRLTQELHREFPAFPPYGGAFDEIVPHLTVPVPDDEEPGELAQALGRSLPIRGMAVEATLVHVEEDDTHLLATFPFGSSAA